METSIALRNPADEDTGIPREWYLGDEWFERDLTAVFRPRWLMAGHIDQLSEPGAYFTFSLGVEECVVRKDDEGRVRAFHNVCSHRAARLCPQEQGKMRSKAIVCPYHGWAYSASDGSLLSAPAMHEDFDRSPWGLHPVHVDVWLGFIFVCFAQERPAPMAEYLADVRFGAYDTSRMKLAAVKTYEVQANWKIVAENNNECYHCQLNHPELISSIDWRDLGTDDYEGLVAERVAGRAVFNGTSVGSTRTLNNASVCKRPIPLVGPAPETPVTVSALWEPMCGMTVSPEHAFMQVPKPVAPGLTQVRGYWFVADDAQEGVDYEVDELTELWDATLRQDRDLCENVQRGAQMPACRPGPLNRVHQGSIAAFYAWYREQIRQQFPKLGVAG